MDGRDRILDVVESLFRERGYTAVTMRDIAKAVGMRQASLYYHFPSKEELFVSVRERMFERHRVGLQNAIEQAGDGLQSQLQAVADWFLSQPSINFHSMMQADMPSLSDAAKVRLKQAVLQGIFEPVGQAFMTAQAKHQIRDVQPKLLVGFVLSVLESIPLVHSPESASREDMVNEIICILLEGIENR
ncbi:MAG: TetR/AcrR family transcriptional regulator [Scytonema sp. PMC 1069.18]|nr:TetR/AcrR family transcriptional regulator [Scytonema sp. PMC 1069.18]MEC4887341.1 TetR/AcrR family transcriptional regulator [Scytonema sp. PMC 1070.18]